MGVGCDASPFPKASDSPNRPRVRTSSELDLPHRSELCLVWYVVSGEIWLHLAGQSRFSSRLLEVAARLAPSSPAYAALRSLPRPPTRPPTPQASTPPSPGSERGAGYGSRLQYGELGGAAPVTLAQLCLHHGDDKTSYGVLVWTRGCEASLLSPFFFGGGRSPDLSVEAADRYRAMGFAVGEIHDSVVRCSWMWSCGMADAYRSAASSATAKASTHVLVIADEHHRETT